MENKPTISKCIIVWLFVWFMAQMVQFGLFLLDSEVENNPQTCPLIYLISLTTFYSKILLQVKE